MSSKSIRMMSSPGASSILLCSTAIIRNGPTGWHMRHGSSFGLTVFICSRAQGSKAISFGDPEFLSPPAMVLWLEIDSYVPVRSGGVPERPAD